MNSFWLDSIENKNKFNKLEKDISTDVCIVGAGIFGLTCGYYLTKQGYNVVLLEKEKDIASKTTGHTTAKITSQHNLIYKYLIDSLGESMAKKYLYANQDAIENIYQIINDKKLIHGDFGTHNFIKVNGKFAGVIDPMPVLGDSLYDTLFAIVSNASVVKNISLDKIYSLLSEPHQKIKAMLIVVLYCRIARCLKYHKHDINIYMDFWNRLTL